MTADTGINAPPNVLLSGIVGSTAYGLDHEGSDIDRLGVHAVPTQSLVMLTRPLASEETVRPDPDTTYHEARKYLSLALKVNPTATELVWLPDHLIETRTPLGHGLITIRSNFLSSTQVKLSYLGYAHAQLRRLQGSPSAVRTAKHARHIARLLAQGRLLYRDGILTLRLDDPQWFLDFGERVAAGDLNLCESLIAKAETAFEAPSPLPEYPDTEAPEAWLCNVRRTYWPDRP